MGIELPPELADVAARANVAWPEADEEAMARSAQAWRDAATSMSTLATDADTTARSALSSVSGEAADRAAAEWKTFVEPDSGHLTAAVRGCHDAADRLENAATQVGAAKVEIVRNLVGLAQNTDAAHAAAAAGHPTALAGLDTAVRGTAANVAHIETQLVSAVQPGAGIDMSTVQNPVNANPGTHLAPGLTTGVVTTVADVTTGATDLVADTAQQVPDVVADPANTGNVVSDTVHQGTTLVGDTVQNAQGTHPNGPGLLPNAPGLVPDGPGNVLPGHPGQVLPGDLLPGNGAGLLPGHPGDVLPGPPGEVPPGQLDPDITGPVPVDVDDTPTPPTGQTVQAGFAGGLEPSAAGPANLPPAAAAPPIANPAAPPGLAGQPAFGGPGFAPGAPGAPPVAPAPGAPAPAAPAPAAPAARVAAAPAAFVPADRPADPAPAARKPMAGPPGAPPPSSRGERDQVLAAFWIHMFPIGHLPVASYRPARQLPPPPEELDYAAGLRFEPADHPDFHLIDGTPRLTELRAAAAADAAAKAEAAAAPIPLPPSSNYPPVPYQQPPSYPPMGQPVPGHPPSYPPLDPQGQSYQPPSHPPVDPQSYAPTGQPPSAYPAASQLPAGRPASQQPVGQPPGAYPAVVQPPVDQPVAGQPVVAAQDQPPPPPPSITVRPSAGRTADHPTVQALLETHDPLAGGHEREWDRRYLVRLGSVTAQGISPEGLEYNWPTSEQYPEGGSDQGEPEILAPDTVIDRFGAPEGRVFAEDGTPFAQRSLPPAHKDAGYRRYKVREPLPVWRAVSAAWFGQPGGGIRYRTTHSAVELVALGYLEEIA